MSLLVLSFSVFAPGSLIAGEEPSREQVEFFESRIRPVLIEFCYECHNSAEMAEGGLSVDQREGLLAGGDGGAAVVPGQPDKSRLLAVLRHDIEGLEMPQDGPKLDSRVIADFEEWIAMGAPDPRDMPPTADEFSTATSWDATLQRRKQWWSFQPIKKPAPPEIENSSWSDRPIDQFVMKKLEASGLRPTEAAEPSALVRRLYFNLVGLPPDPDDAVRWTTRIGDATGPRRDAAVEELVDHLLGSPQFGERWARHWMDWIRYAESHGSEGDPKIDNAWMYRDYLIRALNADVPYNQLVREHVAGDLLEYPRINSQLGINESRIGPAHWRMVFHGFAPTDALDEKVRFVDDQINAFSKAFLGLTVSCARCHDHKFDAISQKDYYALFGILGSCRPGRSVIDVPDRLHRNRESLSALKARIRAAVADDWLDSTKDLRHRLATKDGPWNQADKPSFVLHPMFVVNHDMAEGTTFESAWQNRVGEFLEQSKQNRLPASEALRRWNLGNESDYAEWFRNGAGLPEHPQSAGEFSVATTGETALTGIYPAGVYSHSLSAKHAARLTSADIRVGEENELWVRVIGDAEASLRYAVQHYPRNGTVYPVTKLSNEWRWQRYDLTYWNGDDIHIELVAAQDAPLLVNNKPRSWFGVREAAIVVKGQTSHGESIEHLNTIFAIGVERPPRSMDDLATLYEAAIATGIKAWKDETITDDQALLLDACLRQGLLPNTLDSLSSAKPLLQQYRRLEDEIPVPRRVPGLDETIARNQTLFVRGNHKLPGEEIPRSFLTAIDPAPYETDLSGRRELAEDLLRDDNPLARRVIVNRVWHHLFGRGIVGTPDNLGRLGELPSHPQLLDWLAARFVDDGWSLKSLIRLIVTSKTWQLSSHPSEKAAELDPDNRLLSRANVRRLEAEAIRDALLAVSGQLDRGLYGVPVDGNSPRRSVYVRVIRNSLDPFLRVFDFPEPFSTTGRRDVTNVPAQSLTMMNDERVVQHAEAWAARLVADTALVTDGQRIREMFITAFSRPATQVEVSRAKTFLTGTRQSWEDVRRQLENLQSQIADRQTALSAGDRETVEKLKMEIAKLQSEATAIGHVPQSVDEIQVWADLARALFTFQEFIYLK